MARKVSKGKKPSETMRQRQQRLLREQRSSKAAATKPVKAKPTAPTSQRVEKVKVKVEPQKQLPPSKATKALPPGKKGGAVSTGNKPRRRNVNTNPSSNTTRTASGSKAKPTPKPSKPSLGNRAYVRARQLGVNPTVATDAIAKNATVGRLGGAATAAALLEAGLAATPGPTGRRVRAAQEDRSRREASVREMAGRKGRQVLERLGLVDRKPEPKAAPKTEPTKTKPKSRGMSNIPPSEGSRNNPNYGKPGKPNSANKPTPKPTPAPTYTPPKGKATAPPKKKTGADDSRNTAYTAARKKLNANSTKAERDKVRDMGLKISKGIHGDKGGRGSKPKPATARDANDRFRH